MTYLIIVVCFLAITEIFTLTLLRKRENTIEYYRSREYEDWVFMKRAQKNSEMHKMAKSLNNHFEE